VCLNVSDWSKVYWLWWHTLSGFIFFTSQSSWYTSYLYLLLYWGPTINPLFICFRYIRNMSDILSFITDIILQRCWPNLNESQNPEPKKNDKLRIPLDIDNALDQVLITYFVIKNILWFFISNYKIFDYSSSWID